MNDDTRGPGRGETGGERGSGAAPADVWLARRFEEERPRLLAVAHRMLGSAAEAEDAVQDAWLRLAATESGVIENLSGWLTTVVGRLCLTRLRAPRRRAESPVPLDEAAGALPADRSAGPEDEVLLADAVGTAVLVVLDTLEPAERVAFVLHDMFGVPFEDIARIVGRSPAAARKLASRARARVRGTAEPPNDAIARQRPVVDAFIAAARAGDFDALVAVLDPDATIHDASDPVASIVRGGARIARGAIAFTAAVGAAAWLVLAEGRWAALSEVDGSPRIMLFDVAGERVTALTVVTDPARLREMTVHPVEGWGGAPAAGPAAGAPPADQS